MSLELIGKGLLIGLIFGVPAGAIGALTIQRTLEGGFLYGFLTGLGSSVADVLYAAAGVFGISVITVFLTRYQFTCGLCGALLIIIYGLLILIKKGQKNQKEIAGGKTYLSGFISSFVVAIMNPTTILSFLVAFSTFGLIAQYSIIEGMQIVIGVLIGTGLWWFAISFIVNMLNRRITDRVYSILNRLLGTVLIIFGMVMVIHTCINYFGG